MVRERSAKPLCAGSIPARASNIPNNLDSIIDGGQIASVAKIVVMPAPVRVTYSASINGYRGSKNCAPTAKPESMFPETKHSSRHKHPRVATFYKTYLGIVILEPLY